MTEAIVIDEISRRRNKRYSAEELTYRARVDLDRLPENLRDVPLVAVVGAVRRLFEIIIERCTDNLNPRDLIRICIQSEGLDKPASTCIMQVSELTVEKILSVIMKILQSKDEIKLDSGFTVDVITIRLDVGGAHTKVVNIPIDRLRKKSILCIPEEARGLCCAMAISYAKAHMEDDKKSKNALRDTRRPALVKRAEDLHEAAGVPLGTCTYAEIGQFEEFLDIQIVVVSSENLNKVR